MLNGFFMLCAQCNKCIYKTTKVCIMCEINNEIEWILFSNLQKFFLSGQRGKFASSSRHVCQ